MTILTQDQNNVVFCNNLTKITRVGKEIFCKDQSKEKIDLGHYRNETKAKQILKEILQALSTTEGVLLEQGQKEIKFTTNTKCYEMPKE